MSHSAEKDAGHGEQLRGACLHDDGTPKNPGAFADNCLPAGCSCACHNPTYGMHVSHLVPCCDQSGTRPLPPALPLHRTEAGYPNCSTCDGGGCPDCTDPA